MTSEVKWPEKVEVAFDLAKESQPARQLMGASLILGVVLGIILCVAFT